MFIIVNKDEKEYIGTNNVTIMFLIPVVRRHNA